MFRLEGGRPNDRRGFLHKSFIGKAVGGAVKKFASATPIGAAVTTGLGIGTSLFGRKRDKSVATNIKFATADFAGSGLHDATPHHGLGGRCLHGESSFDCARRVGTAAFGPGGNGGPPQRAPCDFPKVRDSAGRCRTPTSGEFGGEQFGVGAAVAGRYGAAFEPGSIIIDRAVCGKGMTLGNDGLCYNKGAITNKQRQWPRGRRPLLTGGDMRAISIAARAGSKLDRTTKRLRSLGMMKALPKGRGAPRAHAHARPVAAVSV